jgi:mono/diheme cytochrome c family protein
LSKIALAVHSRAAVSLAALALEIASAAAPASAQDVRRGDPAAGARLAAQWCAACHQIAPGGVRNETAPPFAGFAGDAADQPEWLRAWLSTSHPSMPSLNLSRDEIGHLIAYIASLDGRR